MTVSFTTTRSYRARTVLFVVVLSVLSTCFASGLPGYKPILPEFVPELLAFQPPVSSLVTVKASQVVVCLGTDTIYDKHLQVMSVCKHFS